ncbi:MAG: flagellar basal body-associated FliL family protein [Chloroflexi bacterium]|nr:flagellar basal body-associated FliL family protein [Chloroflexota bacterium]
MKLLAPAGVLAVALLLSACGGSSGFVAPPTTFPTTQNLPTLQIPNRVINLNGQSGYKYAKMSLNVQFQDATGEYGKAKGDALKKLQDTFAADNVSTISAFNDVVTTDVSQKTAQDLASADGKEALRQQLLKDFNSRLAGGPQVLYVEFVDFVMQ